LKMAPKHIEYWPHTAPIGTEQVPLTTLDEATKDLTLVDHRVMLKIDVQGYELGVLAGGEECLKHVYAAYVELQFAPLYERQSAYYEIMRTLETAGLRFVGLFSLAKDPHTGNVLFADALFLRSCG
jgi:hypothetical protein